MPPTDIQRPEPFPFFLIVYSNVRYGNVSFETHYLVRMGIYETNRMSEYSHIANFL